MSPADWRPAASLDVLRSRAAMLERIRAWFAAQESTASGGTTSSASPCASIQSHSGADTSPSS